MVWKSAHAFFRPPDSQVVPARLLVFFRDLKKVIFSRLVAGQHLHELRKVAALPCQRLHDTGDPEARMGLAGIARSGTHGLHLRPFGLGKDAVRAHLLGPQHIGIS